MTENKRKTKLQLVGQKNYEKGHLIWRGTLYKRQGIRGATCVHDLSSHLFLQSSLGFICI